MEKVTFWESIIRILKYIASVPFLIEVLILTVLLLLAMLFFYFKKSTKGKKLALLIYIVTLLLLPISNLSFFVNTMDGLIENYIRILYFPNCYIYMIMLVVTDIGVLRLLVRNTKNLEKNKKESIIDILNITYFFLFNFMFFLIIGVVVANNVDIFDTSSLYSVGLLISLIQISSYLFWIRIGIKLLIFVINKLSCFPIGNNKLNIEEQKKLISNNKSDGFFEPVVKYNGPINNNLQNSDDDALINTPINNFDVENVKEIEIIDVIPFENKNSKLDIETNSVDHNYFDDFYE